MSSKIAASGAGLETAAWPRGFGRRPWRHRRRECASAREPTFRQRMWL